MRRAFVARCARWCRRCRSMLRDVSGMDSARARWRAALLVGIHAAVGAALIASGQRLAPALAGARVPLVLVLLGVFCVLPVLGFAAYLWRLGARALDAGRFPPPGTQMVRRGPALVGEPARRRA